MKVIKKTALSIFCVLNTLNLFSSANSNKQAYEVIGIGSAFMDYIIKINDEDLEKMNYPKGSWGCIDQKNFKKVIHQKENNVITSPGGSGGNVIKGLANLGQKCAVLGKVGEDEEGVLYLKCMENLAVTSLMQKTKIPTAQAICFITPDGQRTMRSLGSEKDINVDIDLDKSVFSNIKLLHLEGYQLYNAKLFEKSIEYAKKNGAKVSMDLASVEIVKEFKDDLLNILPKYVDIIFANENEAFELTHLNPQEACDFLATFCDVAVVTMGDKGSWAKSGKVKFYTPALSVDDAIDSTGAGDLFASGFLHGYLDNEPLQRCSWIGSLVASKVVQIYGTEIPKDVWAEINQNVKNHKN